MLTKRQTKKIQSFQNLEIERFLSDAEFSKVESLAPHYSRIGDWLDITVGKRVLELGCGPGRYVAMLASLGFDVVGVDPLQFPTWDRIRCKPNVTLLDGVQAESLPFASDSFDHVACLGALLYFQDDMKSLAEIRRVLKPGGRLVLRTVNKNNLYTRTTGKKLDPASRNLYTTQELVDLLTKSGIEVVETFTYGFWPPFMTDFWWYLNNGRIPRSTQVWLSSITDEDRRINITAFARLPP